MAKCLQEREEIRSHKKSRGQGSTEATYGPADNNWAMSSSMSMAESERPRVGLISNKSIISLVDIPTDRLSSSAKSSYSPLWPGDILGDSDPEHDEDDAEDDVEEEWDDEERDEVWEYPS
jgi:hypothetical protein